MLAGDDITSAMTFHHAKMGQGGFGSMDAVTRSAMVESNDSDGGADSDRLDQRLEKLGAQLAKISTAVLGTQDEVNAGDDNEDRKRLKEKLAKALQRVRFEMERAQRGEGSGA